MASPLLLTDLFTGHEPGRAALLRRLADRQVGPTRSTVRDIAFTESPPPRGL